MDYKTKAGLNPCGSLKLGVDHTLTKTVLGKKHKFG
jgi:hypothetical protein